MANYSVLQFWYLLEQLIPFNLSGKIKDSKYWAIIPFNQKDRDLPWLNPEILSNKFKLRQFNKKGEPIKYRYRIYLGVFKLNEVFDFLKSLPKPVKPAFSDLVSNSKDLSCFFSFQISPDGLLDNETLSTSSVPLALDRVKNTLTEQVINIFTRSKNFTLNGWTEGYRSHYDRLKEYFLSAKASRVNTADLETLLEDLQNIDPVWMPQYFEHLGYYTVERVRDKEETIDNENILNSFYLGDLEAAARYLESNQEISQPLKQYLGETPKRIFVESRDFLQDILAPEYLPQGRWPSNPHHNLSLMQQCAVNLALNSLGDSSGGIFSVNGPPGTGKTTLLRELIADLIVRRASIMAEYRSPLAAFTQKGRFYCLNSSLTGFEMVVASSNNGAVENVSVELPSLDAIYSDYVDRISYFKETALSITAARSSKKDKSSESLEEIKPDDDERIDRETKLSEDNRDRALKLKLKKKSDSPEDSPQIWGTIAAVLGNKKNCNLFCQGFWYDEKNSIRSSLTPKSIELLQQWKTAKSDFLAKRQRVIDLLQERKEIAASARQDEFTLASVLARARARFIESKESLARTVERYQDLERNFSEVKVDFNDLLNYLHLLESNPPSIFSRIFDSLGIQEYQSRLHTAQRELETLSLEVRSLENQKEQAYADRKRLQLECDEAEADFQEKERWLARHKNSLKTVKNQLGQAFADADWWERPHEEFQLSAPWVDLELNEARSELFLAALAVHQAFVRNCSAPLKKNLARWVDLVNGHRKDLTKDDIKHLWQTFFLVVPVVSTTFASISRLFDRLSPESIGWLLIDEAGQCTPAAAVGALQRAKRALVLGDPLQIQPVFTLDPAIVEGLRCYFEIDSHWSPYTIIESDRSPSITSVQTLSDRVNPYGSTISIDDDLLWIGCPLWVHRRCLDPMFTLANTIAYDGKMVSATKANLEKNFPLGESGWIDIDSSCTGRHWVQEQGEIVVKLLQQIVAVDGVLPSLYIISPFRNVAIEMRSLLLKTRRKWASKIRNVNEWIKRSVGTVHTFQGKEADTVILLLGTDRNSQSAARWAASDPNILNVAATRAKYRFYIVGSKSLWSDLNYFDTASLLLPSVEKLKNPITPDCEDWNEDSITAFKAKQTDFINKLRAGDSLYHLITGQQGEKIVISSERLYRLRDFCWEITDKYKDRSEDIHKTFLNNFKGCLGEEAVKDYLGDLITSVNYEIKAGGDGKVDFTLTDNPNIGIQVKTRQGNINTVKWSISKDEIKKNTVLLCVLIQETIDEVRGEYNLILAGFLPTSQIDIGIDERADLGIERLFYCGGLNSYLSIFQGELSVGDETDIPDYFSKGLDCLQKENYQKALEFFSLTIKLGLNIANAYYNLAVIYDRLEKSQRAKDFISKAQYLYRQEGDFLGLKKAFQRETSIDLDNNPF